MKTILIMRHGEAEPVNANDESRPLTERGVNQAKEMAWWLKGHYKPQAVLVSPYIRAQQTAQQVLAINDVTYVEICKDVIPTGNAAFAIDYLETLISLNTQLNIWLIVAHMPIVSYLVEQLCPQQLPIFNTAAVAVIEYDEVTQKGVFKSMNSPSL
ncbi:Phosphohistidine phosphatase SixA [Pseudoalteromonas holothuriae]|uniref:Phosphohistidine phosphatase SixA n=1 Tax=Pseudoalteromonas holothuriae TaxID=2963714 RepID=A0A9W4QZG5_9GAMM|nr:MULTISPECIES: phosphohistidine phosphatase SixA [unclassified Pseudoalteromonas]CAH9059562.1 Phosphohistidine phosphatase SixA [Pseudoalteromonas sp. CIP111854]CAH9064260.1 Phosphohistidine phosphatase SixA [Pseudoalteromonas sp. CIP111951]